MSKAPLPRVNVTVTHEQHSLLLELAQLQGGSAAGFLRQQLDLSTPLLRAAVPLLRQAARETELTRKEAAKLLEEPFRQLKELGVVEQMDIFDADASASSAGAQRSERTRARPARTDDDGSVDDETSNG